MIFLSKLNFLAPKTSKNSIFFGFLVYLNQKNFKNFFNAEKPILCLEMRGIIKKTIFDEYIAINMTLGKRTFYVPFQHVQCATLVSSESKAGKQMSTRKDSFFRTLRTNARATNNKKEAK